MSNHNRPQHATKLRTFSRPSSLKSDDESNAEEQIEETNSQWFRRKFVAVIPWLVAMLVIVGITTGVALKCVKDNEYPDYSALSYTLKHAYEGVTFFDNFDYFTG